MLIRVDTPIKDQGTGRRTICATPSIFTNAAVTAAIGSAGAVLTTRIAIASSCMITYHRNDVSWNANQSRHSKQRSRDREAHNLLRHSIHPHKCSGDCRRRQCMHHAHHKAVPRNLSGSRTANPSTPQYMCTHTLGHHSLQKRHGHIGLSTTHACAKHTPQLGSCCSMSSSIDSDSRDVADRAS